MGVAMDEMIECEACGHPADAPVPGEYGDAHRCGRCGFTKYVGPARFGIGSLWRALLAAILRAFRR